MIRRPPRSTLFPYTTLFRSSVTGLHGRAPHAFLQPCPLNWSGSRDDPSARGERRLEKSGDRKSTRLNSSHSQISYAVFCLKKKTNRRLLHAVVHLRKARRVC